MIGWDSSIYWCVGEFQHRLHSPVSRWITDGAIQCDWLNGHCCWWVQSLNCKLFICVIYSSNCNSDLTCAVHVGFLSTFCFCVPSWPVLCGQLPVCSSTWQEACPDLQRSQKSENVWAPAEGTQPREDHWLKTATNEATSPKSRPPSAPRPTDTAQFRRQRKPRVCLNAWSLFFIVHLHLGSVFLWQLTLFLLKMGTWNSV